MGTAVRLAADAQGSRPGVPRLSALRRLHPGRGQRRGAHPLLHDLGHALAARGVPRARLHARAAPGRLRRLPRGAEPRHGEGLLMARPRRPARPLLGYRDVGEDVRHSRQAVSRAWVILAIMVVLYLAWTLTVYFIEPGLR